MDRKRAIELLKQKSKEAVHVAKQPYYANESILWRRNIEDILESAFGVASTEYKRVAELDFGVVRGTKVELQRAYVRKVHRIQQEVDSIIQKHEILGVETQPAVKAEPPDSPKDYEETSTKELELILEGTPDMIIECIMNFVRKLNSQGYAYKSIPRIGGAPDFAEWDRTYSTRCAILETCESGDVQIGTIRLTRLPKEQTLLSVPEPKDLESPFGVFLSYLLGEFKRLGFVHFEEEKPPMGFRPLHKEKDV